ncbi:NYN domain-containing protein [Tolypothrix sp. FACHB-123]|uniref:LabA-like NYN domain-containing protein n=1 Tax=Tolypothrix sp. FACHB-123 TaxID=2692868 RepID=UPI0016881209|nr:NYN domain-containing protein [Tolypothrix sp. FACHB-123]MBD2353593.1 NYN domain-containing protein [Tolypothrix sp. FACHB-123]
MNINTFTTEKDKDKPLNEGISYKDKNFINNEPELSEIRKPNSTVSSLLFQGIHRGRVAIFIDGINLFHAALQVGLEIDYLKLLCRLTENSRLLRAFFYTGIDMSRPPAIRLRSQEKQQGFLFWMRRNGYRVVTKEFQPVENYKKPNLNVEIAVDMINLAPYYDTAVLVSGDGDLAYAVNAVTSTGARVEVVSLRAMTSDILIDVADYFIDLDSIKQYIQKDAKPGYNYRILSNSGV